MNTTPAVATFTPSAFAVAAVCAFRAALAAARNAALAGQGYLAAPATHLVATRCACCGRDLVDAKSVETGVGPECRRRYGYGTAEGEPDWLRAASALATHPGCLPVLETLGNGTAWGTDARVCANRIVYHVAALGTGCFDELVPLAQALWALGFVKFATRLVERLGAVTVREEFGRYTVEAPYSEGFTDAMRGVPGRRWDRDAKVNCVPLESRTALFAALRRACPGHVLVGARGIVRL